MLITVGTDFFEWSDVSVTYVVTTICGFTSNLDTFRACYKKSEFECLAVFYTSKFLGFHYLGRLFAYILKDISESMNMGI